MDAQGEPAVGWFPEAATLREAPHDHHHEHHPEDGGNQDHPHDHGAVHLEAEVRATVLAFAQEVEREVLGENVVMGDGNALYLAEVRSRGSVGDREVDSRGVETAFLVMTQEGWRIRHFHWSTRR